MLILTFRTDNEQAELGLYDGQTQLVYESWHAHRKLAETISTKIVDVLLRADKRLHDVQGIVIFKGPGSFTGLRISMSVANALAYSLRVPIVATMEDGWIDTGITKLLGGESEYPVVPEYGSVPHITAPKH